METFTALPGLWEAQESGARCIGGDMLRVHPVVSSNAANKEQCDAAPHAPQPTNRVRGRCSSEGSEGAHIRLCRAGAVNGVINPLDLSLIITRVASDIMNKTEVFIE